MMISLNQIELALAACGGLSIVWTIFRLGQLTERRRHRRKRHVRAIPYVQPEAKVLQFKTPEEVAIALGEELKKGKKGDPDIVENLVSLQNKFRKTA